MKVILNADQIDAALADLAAHVIESIPSKTDIVVIGLRSRGEIIAQRLAASLSQKLSKTIPCGTLDITLYRDDINDPHGHAQPTVRSTEIPFDISEKIVILVDDVLYTGRSIRAAMDALIDLGRPKAIRLAVLVDRGHRELPIQADFYAVKIEVAPNKSVEVSLVETDDKDQVIVE
jgi:pyrimidine operon attenuation protein/uracil phosphoribosyltransferase